jgi:hypothetical protein
MRPPLEYPRGVRQIRSRLAEEIEILGIAMAEIETGERAAAGQMEALLARKKAIEQVTLEQRQPARRR